MVQRHRATRLHYDFRLEIDGVLVSWAVPRGPSMRPLERRMAARTEDHPVEYLDFEGVIPKGEYGGGDVIVWDIGTWEPEAETADAAQAVAAGELKFVLHGERLRGRFVIVRTSGRRGALDADDGQDQWLLMHKRDADADPAWDIDTFPTSVLSGRTNDEIKAGAPALWDSSKPAAEARIDLAAAVEAPLPRLHPADARDPGRRPVQRPRLAVRDEARRVPRGGGRGPGHGAALDPQPPGRGALLPGARRWADPTGSGRTSAVVDGEVVAIGPDGNADFSLLQDRTGLKGLGIHRGDRRAGEDAEPDAPRAPLVLQLFDLLYLDGRSLLGVPLEDRKRLLRRVVRDTPGVRYLSHIDADGLDLYAAAEAHGVEGIIAKLRRSTYDPGKRSRAWLKIKIRREQELVVVGYETGKGSHADLGALLVATFDDDAYRYAGEVGSGIDTRTRRALRARLDELAADAPTVADPPRLPAVHWVEPRIVIRATFAEWTSDGLLRQAAFLGLEPDRDPRSVSRERPVAVDPARRAAERSSTRRAPTIRRPRGHPSTRRPRCRQRQDPRSRRPPRSSPRSMRSAPAATGRWAVTSSTSPTWTRCCGRGRATPSATWCATT